MKKIILILVCFMAVITAVPVMAQSMENISDWAKYEVRNAKNLHFIESTEGIDYKKPISRKEFLMILYTIMKAENKVDSSSDGGMIDFFVNSGILQGYEDGDLGLNNNITRAEVAVILSYMLDLDTYDKEYIIPYNDDIPSWAKDSIYNIQQANIMSGDSMWCFNQSQECTGEEAIVSLMRFYKTGILCEYDGIEGQCTDIFVKDEIVQYYAEDGNTFTAACDGLPILEKGDSFVFNCNSQMNIVNIYLLGAFYQPCILEDLTIPDSGKAYIEYVDYFGCRKRSIVSDDDIKIIANTIYNKGEPEFGKKFAADRLIMLSVDYRNLAYVKKTKDLMYVIDSKYLYNQSSKENLTKNVEMEDGLTYILDLSNYYSSVNFDSNGVIDFTKGNTEIKRITVSDILRKNYTIYYAESSGDVCRFAIVF